MAKIWKFSKPVILASGSPRRKELMSEITSDFTVLVPDCDESAVEYVDGSQLVERTAALKLECALTQFDCTGKIVIAADTIVYYGKKYGKPSSLENAVEMLTTLSGKTHIVYTGVAIAVDGRCAVTFFDSSEVKLKSMTREEIEDYVYTFKPLDKAGAYAIQENTMVEAYSGDYTNIVGLPMRKLECELTKLGVLNG